MAMNAELKGLARHFFGLLLAFSVIWVAAYFLFERIANPPGTWTELVKANPGFDIIRTPSHRLLIMTDSAKKRAFLMESNGGYSTGYDEIGSDGLLVADTYMRYGVGDTVEITACHLRDKTLGIVYFEPER